MEAKEGWIITCVAAGVVKVVPSVTVDLQPQVGEGVSEPSVVSGLPMSSSASMAVEDSLSEREESVMTEPASWLWIRLSGSRTGSSSTQCERLWGLCRSGGSQAAGSSMLRGAWLEPLPDEIVVSLKGTMEEGHEAEACLDVSEAFTSNTLAVKVWFPSWVWGKK